MARGLSSESCVIEMLDVDIAEQLGPQSRYNATYRLLRLYDIDNDQEFFGSNARWKISPFLNDLSDYLTFIHFAAYHGYLDLLELVVESHPDSILAADEFGRCALHFAANQGRHEIIKWLLERSFKKPHPQLSLQDRYGRTPLHAAVLEKHVDTVKLLAMEGADVNVIDVQGYSPLMVAHRDVLHYDSNSKCQYEQIVDILATHMAYISGIDPRTNWSALHYAVSLGSIMATRSLLPYFAYANCYSQKTTTPVHIAVHFDYNDILSTLLTVLPPSYFDSLNKDLWSPLHLAAVRGNLEGVRALVDKGGNLAKETPKGETVIDLLHTYNHDSNLVEFFTDMLDAKVRLSEKMKGTPYNAYNISLDFGILAPRDQPQMAVVSALMNTLPKNQQKVILQHPLLNIYLEEKWFRLRYLFHTAIMIQLIFVMFLSYYTIVLVGEDTESTTPRRMLLFLAFIPFCNNLLQFFGNPWRCCKRFENSLGLICTMISIAMTVAGEFSCLTSWILHAVSIATLLSWIQIMLLAGRLPACGFYALMISTVLKNVLKVLCIGMCIIAGFTLSFSVLFHDNDQFKTPLKTFVKTMVMMTGEYDYENLFHPDCESRNNSITSNSDHDESRMQVTGRIILLLFIILAGIVLMNLMIGLAVSDIQGLVMEGQFSRLVKQAEFITDYERMTRDGTIWGRLMPTCLKRRLKSTIETEANQLFSWEHEPNPGISKKLWVDLFQLGLKNQKLNPYYDGQIEDHIYQVII